MTADTTLTTVKVTTAARDRLAVLAAEAHQSIGAFIAGVADRIPTAAELDARDERTRHVLAQLGVDLTPADRQAGEALWAALDAGDDDALDALGAGNSILARLLFGTPRGVDDVVAALYRGPRLLAPALSLLQAGRRRTGLAEHIAALETLRIVELDTAAIVALCGPLADLDSDTGHAIHTAARNDASVITPTPELYPESVRTVRLPL